MYCALCRLTIVYDNLIVKVHVKNIKKTLYVFRIVCFPLLKGLCVQFTFENPVWILPASKDTLLDVHYYCSSSSYCYYYKP